MTGTLRSGWHALGLCVGALGLACAPAQSFRPPGVLPSDRQGEVGVAFSRVGPRPYVSEGARPMAQGWWSTRWGETWLSSVLFGFDQSAVLGGWALRKDLVQSTFSASAEAELGLLWAAVSVPVSVRVDRIAPYCAPRLGTWGSDVTGFLPCGLSIGPWQGFSLRAEAELSWADFEYYNRRLHLGIAVAQQW